MSLELSSVVVSGEIANTDGYAVHGRLHLCGYGEGLPLWTLIDDPRKYPSPQGLSDQQVEKTLKSLLARMAIYGRSVSLCSHLTPRDAYRVLLQEVFPEEGYYPEERLTQWVSCFTLANHCPQCQAEFEREYEQLDRTKRNRGEED